MAAFEIFIPIPQPFSFELTVRKPAGWPWGTPGEIYRDGVLYTAARLPDWRLVGLMLMPQSGGVAVSAHSRKPLGAKDRQWLQELLRLGLGADDDLEAFYRLARRDALVKRLRDDLYGMRLGFLTGIYERALLVICLQMVPIARSIQMRECLIETYGESITVGRRRIRYWPSPARLAAASIPELRERCRLGYRARAIHEMSQAMAAGFPDVVTVNKMDEAQADATIRSLYGIGEYSAQIVSPHRGFPLDVWSARIFFEIMHGETPAESPRKLIREIETEAKERWGEYRRYVFVYVLNDLANLLREYPISRLA